MLSRPATKLSLTADDIIAYEQRKMARDAMKEREVADSNDTSRVSSQSDATDMTPAAQSRAARSNMSKNQRIGVGSSRG